MPQPSPTFTFDRARGVVWVCDVADSTKFLNDDGEVDALEEYFPRLYWAALQAVDAADGVFIKWTGDGFLAWFPAILERQLGQVANNVFTAAWHLTLLSNVTSLGVKTSAKIRLRHGVAYEPDALVLRITGHDGHASQDLIGRAVVRAFRMSGISSGFPSVVTEGALAKSYEQTEERPITFQKRKISQEERLKYFKGERLGTAAIYVPAESPKRKKQLKSVVRDTKHALKSFEAPLQKQTVPTKFSSNMLNGPEWSNKVARDLYEFVDKRIAKTLRELLPVLEQQMKKREEPANPSLQETAASGHS